MQKNNKSKIDKLKALDKSIEASKQVQAKTDDVQYRSPKGDWSIAIEEQPTAPKSFGTWLDVYKVVSDGKIYPNSQSAWYMDDNSKMQKIDFSLLSQYVMQECSQTTDKIIKLNEEMTAENAKLCQSNDDLSLANESLKHQLEVTTDKLKHARDDAKMMHNVNNDLLGLFRSSTNELTSIKSKWWYKFITWGWK